MLPSMRRSLLLSAICIFILAWLSAGCYESEFPLDSEPQADLAAGLPGAWHCVTSDPGDRDLTLTIERTRDRVYAVTLREFGQEPDQYEAHTSMVGGVAVVNLRNLKPSSNPWVFVRYSLLQSKVLQLQVVDDKAMKGVDPSPAVVRQFIEQRMKDAALFADVCTCVRMNEK